MEEVDEIRSRPSSGDSLSPDPPIGIKTTAKSLPSPPSPPSPRNGLELVGSPPTQAVTSGGSHGGRSVGGGGRDDCWSEEATGILIDAWGERYLELKRGNLKQQHWKKVAEIVNTSTGSSKSPKTDVQCKNRIDTVKKKFKQEKAKIAAGNDNGKWIFFKKLENLIGGATTATASKALMVTPLSSRSSLYQRKAKSTALLQQKQQASVKRSGESTRWHFRKRIASETESESEPDLSVDSADDGLPPPPLKMDKIGDEGRRELGEVAMAVIGFAESYEKAETAKLKQLVELEKERMKFAKELELQRIQFFKSQLEMLRNIQEDGDSERIIMSHGSVMDNGNIS